MTKPNREMCRAAFDGCIRVLAGAGRLILLAVAVPVICSASNISVVGGSYSLGANNTVTLTANGISNLSVGNPSGSLRLELWAFPFQYFGFFPPSGYYRLAVYEFGPLNGGASLPSVTSGSVSFTAPAGASLYYPTLLITEHSGTSSSDDGFMPTAAFVNFSPLVCQANGPCGSGNVTFHNGSVQHHQKVYTIFWSPAGSSFPTGYQTTINQFVQDLGGSSYYAITNQYSDAAGQVGTHVSLAGTWLDTASTLPSSPPSVLSIAEEVVQAMTVNNWSTDSDSIFMVYTPGDITGAGYCAYHSAFSLPTSVGTFGLVLYPENQSNNTTCLKYTAPYPNGQAIDNAIDATAHELTEAASDPAGGGWYLVNGFGEIGDLCADLPGPRDAFGADLTLNSRRYLVQMLWSNAASGCAMSYNAPNVPGISLSPGLMIFANQNPNTSSRPQTITVTSSGNAALTISNVSITGTNSADFLIGSNTCSTSLAAGASCTIGIIFQPVATGVRTATLSIADNATGSPHSVVLAGLGGVPIVSLSPGTLSFGNQITGTTSATHTVNLTNTGNATLDLTDLEFAGANPEDFDGTTNCTSSIAVGASCSLSFTFTPTSTGPRSATLVIGDNAADSPQQLSLTGTGLAAPTTTAFSITDKSASSTVTDGSGTLTTGYARILASAGATTPAGIAIFGYRPAGVLVSETGVPAAPLLTNGLLYVEVGAGGNTGRGTDIGIAIANPGTVPATITFTFTDSTGSDSAPVSYTLPAGQQFAAYLDQAPWKLPLNSRGTMTFSSTVGVSVVALQLYNNERGESLITTLPVLDTTAATSTTPAVLSHFADGAGWTTSILLVNPTDSSISGTIQFHADNGSLITLSANGQSGTSFNYSVPRRSSFKLQTSGIGNMQSGSAVVTPSGGTITPVSLAVFSFGNGTTTVTQAGVPSNNGTAFRVYVEATSDLGTVGTYSTGVAVANASSSAGTVTFELYNASGASTGLTKTVPIAGLGHTAQFLTDIFPGVALPFKGLLRVTTTTSAISVVALRLRYNERSELLMTTTPPSDENGKVLTGEFDFPQIVNGGGFTTQFILFSGTAGQATSGTLQLVKSDGTSFGITPHIVTGGEQ